MNKDFIKIDENGFYESHTTIVDYDASIPLSELYLDSEKHALPDGFGSGIQTLKFDSIQKSWEMFYPFQYSLDEQNKIIGIETCADPTNNPRPVSDPVHVEEHFFDNNQYFWSSIESKPQKLPAVPADFVMPKWHLGQEKWIESTNQEEVKRVKEENRNQRIDSEIKEWCIEQGKNEEYYINCGIENGKEDARYKMYRAKVSVFKKLY